MINVIPQFLSRRITQNPYRMLQRLAKNNLEIKSAIHVGAHLAQERKLYEEIGIKKVVWVEASPSTCVDLERTLTQEKVDGTLNSEHLVANALLSDQPGQEVTLYGYTNAGASNSVFQPTETFRKRWPHVATSGKNETVTSSCLDDVAIAMGIESPDLIVLDVQGAELLVLKGGLKTIARAKVVICEVSKAPIYEGGVLLPEIKQFFAAHGFRQMHAAHSVGDVLFLNQQLKEI